MQRLIQRITNRISTGLRTLAAASVLGAAVLSSPALATPAAEHDYQSTPTGWWWLQGVSAAQISDKISDGFRLIDLEVESTAPYTFTAAFVKNTGEYASGWWWYYNASGADVADLLDANNARLIDLQVYRINGVKKYAVIMVPNTGENAKAWWYYTDISWGQLGDLLNQNNARPVDVDTYVVNGTRYFSVVMVKRTGEDNKPWWIYSNVSIDFISQKMSEHNARIVDIEKRGDNYLAVLTPREGFGYWWYYNLTEDQLNFRLQQNGARPIDVEKVSVNGQTRYHAIMLNNSNALTTEVGETLRDGTTGGAVGFRLEKVNGPTLASLMPDYEFYPASSVKIMHHAYAMWAVEVSPWITLGTNIPVYYGTSCNNSGSATWEPLEDVLELMMENSSNTHTNAIQDYFGQGNINSFAHETLGCSDGTQLNHKLGCGGPNNDPANAMTCRDLNLIYEAFRTDDLYSDANLATLYELMLDGNWFADLMADERPGFMSDADYNAFLNGVEMARKAGNISPDGAGYEYRTVGGWIKLPTRYCDNTNREYLFSVFFHDTIIDGGVGLKPTCDELLRDEVREAMEAFALCQPCDGDFDEDGDVDAEDLAQLLANWGVSCPGAPCPWDIDQDGEVGAGDLARLLAAWGDC